MYSNTLTSATCLRLNATVSAEASHWTLSDMKHVPVANSMCQVTELVHGGIGMGMEM